MHEVHLVRTIVDTVEKQAAAQKAKSVKRVKIRFNSLTSHSADHVQFSFDIVKKDSQLMKDAILELNEVEPLLHCNKCGHRFNGHHLPDVCPNCGAVDVKAVNSTDMVLESFEVES
ncbi:MAG TPA: hydrogenase maturation nickel metallochaperone HypA [Verrucomicrobiae bacterium]|nr:hydrogenase maturation nickel metallochaperone HypA [Verrucomicrobiae bacterium]